MFHKKYNLISPILAFICIILFSCSKPIPTVDDILKSAEEKIHRGQNDEAIKILKELHHNHPNHQETIRNLAYAYSQNNEYQLAGSFYRKLSELNPEANIYRLYSAQFYTASSDFENAIEVYKLYLEIVPNDAATWKTLGQLYQELNKNSEAEKAYQNSYKHKQSEDIAIRIGKINLHQLKNFTEAEKWFQIGLEGDNQTNSESYLGMLELSFIRKDYDIAEKIITKLDAAHPHVLDVSHLASKRDELRKLKKNGSYYNQKILQAKKIISKKNKIVNGETDLEVTKLANKSKQLQKDKTKPVYQDAKKEISRSKIKKIREYGKTKIAKNLSSNKSIKKSQKREKFSKKTEQTVYDKKIKTSSKSKRPKVAKIVSKNKDIDNESNQTEDRYANYLNDYSSDYITENEIVKDPPNNKNRDARVKREKKATTNKQRILNKKSNSKVATKDIEQKKSISSIQKKKLLIAKKSSVKKSNRKSKNIKSEYDVLDEKILASSDNSQTNNNKTPTSALDIATSTLNSNSNLKNGALDQSTIEENSLSEEKSYDSYVSNYLAEFMKSSKQPVETTSKNTETRVFKSEVKPMEAVKVIANNNVVEYKNKSLPKNEYFEKEITLSTDLSETKKSDSRKSPVISKRVDLASDKFDFEDRNKSIDLQVEENSKNKALVTKSNTNLPKDTIAKNLTTGKVDTTSASRKVHPASKPEKFEKDLKPVKILTQKTKDKADIIIEESVTVARNNTDKILNETKGLTNKNKSAVKDIELPKGVVVQKETKSDKIKISQNISKTSDKPIIVASNEIKTKHKTVKKAKKPKSFVSANKSKKKKIDNIEIAKKRSPSKRVKKPDTDKQKKVAKDIDEQAIALNDKESKSKYKTLNETILEQADKPLSLRDRIKLNVKRKIYAETQTEEWSNKTSKTVEKDNDAVKTEKEYDQFADIEIASNSYKKSKSARSTNNKEKVSSKKQKKRKDTSSKELIAKTPKPKKSIRKNRSKKDSKPKTKIAKSDSSKKNNTQIRNDNKIHTASNKVKNTKNNDEYVAKVDYRKNQTREVRNSSRKNYGQSTRIEPKSTTTKTAKISKPRKKLVPEVVEIEQDVRTGSNNEFRRSNDVAAIRPKPRKRLSLADTNNKPRPRKRLTLNRSNNSNKDDSNGSQSVSYNSLLGQAESLISAGKYLESINILHKILEKDDNRAEPWILLSLSYLKAEQPDYAIKASYEAVKRWPEIAIYAVNYLKVIERTSSKDKLYQEILKIKGNFSNSPEIELYQGHTYANVFKQPVIAKKHYEEFIKLAPNHPHSKTIRAKIRRLNSEIMVNES